MKIGIIGCGYVGSSGILKTVHPALTAGEYRALRESARILNGYKVATSSAREA